MKYYYNLIYILKCNFTSNKHFRVRGYQIFRVVIFLIIIIVMWLQKICFLFDLLVLAVRGLGGCGDWRPAACQRWETAFRPLSWGSGVLERPGGEGVCKVRGLSKIVSWPGWFWSLCNEYAVMNVAGWTAAMRLYLEAPRLRALRISPVEWQRCMSWKNLHPTCSASSEELWREAPWWAAP